MNAAEMMPAGSLCVLILSLPAEMEVTAPAVYLCMHMCVRNPAHIPTQLRVSLTSDLVLSLIWLINK
jgi:hypothetical protein